MFIVFIVGEKERNDIVLNIKNKEEHLLKNTNEKTTFLNCVFVSDYYTLVIAFAISVNKNFIFEDKSLYSYVSQKNIVRKSNEK